MGLAAMHRKRAMASSTNASCRLPNADAVEARANGGSADALDERVHEVKCGEEEFDDFDGAYEEGEEE